MITVQPNVLNVSQVNTYIKSLVDGDINLSTVFVVGEISNFTNHYRTGHYYFTLKDEISSLKAVMFRTANQRLRFMPENGMKIICYGRISVYERDGIYQLYVEDMQPDGIGALNVRFEQLKSKLEKEGLFSEENKKTIPQRPSRIGVITSPTGAALQDILNVIERRFPLCEIVLAPVEVQGDNAAVSMVNALKKLDELNCVDLIIIGRGGGSIEDLWSFNDESLARTIYSVSTPVISAVGHETDYTICDFVADLRAPTPSAAAEISVPDISEEKDYVLRLKSYLSSLASGNITALKNKVEKLRSNPCFYNKQSVLEIYDKRVNSLKLQLDSNFNSINQVKYRKVLSLYSKLDALDPTKVLLRGYSIMLKDGKNVNSINDIFVDDCIDIMVSDGKLKCNVIETEKS